MRFLQIVWVFAKYLVFYKLTVHGGDILGRRLKLAFEELGLTFIKIGQILSMRYDLLSRENCHALQELLDNITPVPFDTVIKIIETDLAVPNSQIFTRIERQPIATASVSQVHRAVLLGGEEVAVKVKRPGVERTIARDMRILINLSYVAERIFPTLKRIKLRELVKHFERWVRDDVDFRKEVGNMKLMQKQFRSARFSKSIIVPEVFERFCGAQIIVMEYIQGIPLNKAKNWKLSAEHDLEKSVQNFLNAIIKTWFDRESNVFYFQADPHLSNLMLLPKGRIAIVDFGLIDKLDKREADITNQLMLAVYLKDIDEVLEIALQMTGSGNVTEANKDKIRPEIQKYLRQTESEGIGFWFTDMVRIMIKNQIEFPPMLTAFGRANLLIDGVVETFFPEKTTLDLIGDELRRQTIRATFYQVWEADWVPLAYKLANKAREIPGLIMDAFDNPMQVLAEFRRVVRKAS